jgi:hypothetical protein
MGIPINLFYQLYTQITLKQNVGGTLTPDAFNNFCQQSNLQLMAEDYQTFFKTKVVTNFLQTFLKKGLPQMVPPTNPIVPYASDFQYLSNVSHYYKKIKYDCELVDNVDWYKIQVPNSLEYPTLRDSKYQQLGTGIELAPKDIAIVYVDYFSTPIAPIWNYTIVSNRKVYNPVGSVNFQCDMVHLNRLMAIFLQFIGIELKDSEIAGFSQQLTAETKVIA